MTHSHQCCGTATGGGGLVTVGLVGVDSAGAVMGEVLRPTAARRGTPFQPAGIRPGPPTRLADGLGPESAPVRVRGPAPRGRRSPLAPRGRGVGVRGPLVPRLPRRAARD